MLSLNVPTIASTGETSKGIALFRPETGTRLGLIEGSWGYSLALCHFQEQEALAFGDYLHPYPRISFYAPFSGMKVGVIHMDQARFHGVPHCLEPIPDSFSKDKDLLVSGTNAGYIEVWDTRRKTEREIRWTVSQGMVCGFCFVESRKWVCGAGETGEVKAWNLSRYSPVQVLDCPSRRSAIEYGGPDFPFLLTSSAEDSDASQCIQMVDCDSFQVVNFFGGVMGFWFLRQHPQRTHLVFGGRYDGKICLFDLRRANECVAKQQIHQHPLRGRLLKRVKAPGRVINLGLSTFCSSLPSDSVIRIWDSELKLRTELKTDGRHNDICCVVSLDPDEGRPIGIWEDERIAFINSTFGYLLKVSVLLVGSSLKMSPGFLSFEE